MAARTNATRAASGNRARSVWLVPLAAALLCGAAIAFAIRNLPFIGWNPDTILDPLALVIALAYSILGAAIAYRRPGNRIAWICMLMGLSASVYLFAMQYSIYAFLVARQPLYLAAELSWVQSWAWFLPLNLLVLLVFLFPDGRAISPRWNAFALLVAAMIPVVVAVTFVYLWPFRGPLLFTPDGQLPPAVRQSQEQLGKFWGFIIGLPLFAGMPAAVASLFLRLRRAGSVERQQIKWFLFAGGMFAAGLVINLLILIRYPNWWLGDILWNTLLPVLAALIPVAIALAILRHRLYDIDNIIRRTLLYSILTGLLVSVYLVSVIALQALLAGITGSHSPLAVVLSTLFIAALFNPLRQRLHAAIDRRFYRSRYSTDRLMSGLTAALQSEVDVDQLATSLTSTVEQAIQPESVTLWLRAVDLAGQPDLEGDKR